MEANYNQKVKIDWKVLAICGQEERDDPEAVIYYKTKGYVKFGKGEIVVIGRTKNATKITDLINTFGRMLAEGEEFLPDCVHTIVNSHGSVDYKFNIIYGEYENGEKFIQLLPDFEREGLRHFR